VCTCAYRGKTNDGGKGKIKEQAKACWGVRCTTVCAAYKDVPCKLLVISPLTIIHKDFNRRSHCRCGLWWCVASTEPNKSWLCLVNFTKYKTRTQKVDWQTRPPSLHLHTRTRIHTQRNFIHILTYTQTFTHAYTHIRFQQLPMEMGLWTRMLLLLPLVQCQLHSRYGTVHNFTTRTHSQYDSKIHAGAFPISLSRKNKFCGICIPLIASNTRLRPHCYVLTVIRFCTIHFCASSLLCSHCDQVLYNSFLYICASSLLCSHCDQVLYNSLLYICASFTSATCTGVWLQSTQHYAAKFWTGVACTRTFTVHASGYISGCM